MPIQTKAQRDLDRAAELVQRVKDHESKETCDIYGGLCHAFPVMVRTCGLCQAVAFSAAKAQSDNEHRKKAHSLLLQHVGLIIDAYDKDCKDTGLQEQLLDKLRKESAPVYMLDTRRVLSSWIYFKRFAESILKVKNAQSAEEGNDSDPEITPPNNPESATVSDPANTPHSDAEVVHG